MGLINYFKSLFGSQDIIADSIELLNGKLDVNSLTTVFATYLFTSKLAPSLTVARSQAVSFAERVDSSINLNDGYDVKDIISKLTLMESDDSSELAYRLKKAVTLIRSIGYILSD